MREGERLCVCVCESVSVCLSVSERIQANLKEEAIHIEHIEHRLVGRLEPKCSSSSSNFRFVFYGRGNNAIHMKHLTA